MRVTPKTRLSPLAMMNSEEALARPVRNWTTRNERSILERPSILAGRLHLGLREHHARAVDIACVLHRALASFQRGLADPGPERRLVVEAAHGHRADNGIEGHVLQRRDQLLGVG